MADRESTRLEGYWRFEQREIWDDSWPSRPNQKQFEFEPPRVVADAIRNGRSTSERNPTTMGGEECSQEGHQSESGPVAPSSDGGCSMGDATQLFRNGGSDNAGGGQRSEAASQSGDASWKRSLEHTNNNGYERFSDKRWKEQNWAERSEIRNKSVRSSEASDRTERTAETERPLGRNPDGSAYRMDYAELCVSGDNRTDELRLLGNGVVPAVAERAFRTLSARFA